MAPVKPTRLAIVLSHPTQYYSPWFRWMTAHHAVDLRVFYLWQFGVQATLDQQFKTTFKWDVDLLTGYAHEFVENVASAPGTHHFWGLRNPSLTARLSTWAPDVILLFGYKTAAQLNVIRWARMHRIPLIFRGDSHLLGRNRPAWHARLALRILYAQFDAITSVGAANREYFKDLGVPDAKLFFAPHAVNDTLFDPTSADTHKAAAALRKSMGLSAGTKVVLFAGKFVGAKQPRQLLEAFMAVRPPDAALVFVGDGEEKESLHAIARSASPGTVFFLPFANQSEMPSRYLMADIFSLPSRGHYETWGLAVNEAMHMGVPPLVSDRVGCQQDLVTDGETGWVFAAEDYLDLKEKLRIALAADLTPVKRRVAERIKGYTYQQATAGLLAAIRSIHFAA
jgi:glycosyltransferase involved in cell wall biosynthesis